MSSQAGVRLNVPFLQGACLALNALPDAYLLGDGPSCIFDKGEHIHGRHDLFSTLLSCESRHRIQHTGVNVFNISGNIEGVIVSGLRKVAAYPGCGAVILGAMPMCVIAGTDYERVLREALAGTGKPAFLMPGRTAVSGDWLDGYAGLLEVLAAGLDLDGARPEPRKVALVGYFMDRNEGEHWGNLKELGRMLGAVDLDPVSVWLSGRPFAHLGAARRAEAVITLPHARKAGAVLARRLGVKLVEAELPFGLEASRRFMALLGREFGREREAADFTRRELDAVVPRLEWTVPHAFLRRRFAFVGDPFHAELFVEQIESLGGRMAGMMILGLPRHLPAERRKALLERPGTFFEPVPNEVRAHWASLAGGGADLIVGSSFPYQELDRGPRWMEFGFPSESTHFLRDEPFLGFQGALGFLSRTANEVCRGLMCE